MATYMRCSTLYLHGNQYDMYMSAFNRQHRNYATVLLGQNTAVITHELAVGKALMNDFSLIIALYN